MEKYLTWNQSAELWHCPHFISGALNRKLHPILCTASYRTGKNRFLKTCNFELIYKSASSFTKIRQLPASSREWSRQSQAAELEGVWATLAPSCEWCKEPRAGWLHIWPNFSVQLSTVLAGNASLDQCWLRSICELCRCAKGQPNHDQLHMKWGSWGSKALLAP